jgi:hypothetical protein
MAWTIRGDARLDGRFINVDAGEAAALAPDHGNHRASHWRTARAPAWPAS